MMTVDKQKLLVGYLLSNEDVFTRVNSIVDTSYFDPEVRQSVQFIKEYFEKYKASPDTEQVRAETGTVLQTKELTRQEIDYATDEIEKYCRNMAIKNAILIGPKLLADQDFGALEKAIKDAIAVGLNRDMGTDYFADPETRLKQMLLNQNSISTGWSELDELLNGGVNRKEMTLYMANSGVGKSIVMSNQTVNHLYDRKNVLYITLELAEEVVSKRFDSMITGISQSDIFSKISKVACEVQNQAQDCGKLIVKRMPESTTCSNDIRAYLKEFEMLYGYIPDVIVVDYLDLMTSNNKISVENLFVKDKYVAEELRSIANDFNCVMITASQMGRAALDTDDLHQGHIQGGISKVNTTDNLIAILQSEAMKAAGEYMLKLVKTRSSSGVGKHLVLAWDSIGLRVTNLHAAPKKVTLEKESNAPPTRRDITSLMTV